jgi:hypothetical protein
MNTDPILESKVRFAVNEARLSLTWTEQERLISEILLVTRRYFTMSDGERMAHQRGMD